MKAILKTDESIFFIDRNNKLQKKRLSGYTKNIPHIGSQKPLYGLMSRSGDIYPVYYMHENRHFISNDHISGEYEIFYNFNLEITYTDLNLSLLDDL